MKFKLVSTNDRKLNINLDKINLYVSRYKPNTAFDFEITRRQKKKSDPLRRYYFSTVARKYAEHLGYEEDELLIFHHQLKVTFFKHDSEYEIHQDKKGMWRNVPSVFGNNSDMVVGKKQKFVEWVIRKASIDGVYIPDPGEKG